jgi:hypothetical protein
MLMVDYMTRGTKADLLWSGTAQLTEQKRAMWSVENPDGGAGGERLATQCGGGGQLNTTAATLLL